MTNRPPRIVVVDDDFDFLDVQRCILESKGYSVKCFCRPDEAFEYLAENTPDLVITDLMMDTLDAGFALARRIKEEPKLAGLPVIVLTAISHRRGYDISPENDEQLKAMKIDGFLEKPVDPDALLELVDSLLKGVRPEKP